MDLTQFDLILERVKKPEESKNIRKYLEQCRNEINEDINMFGLKFVRIKVKG
jgi:hypothetical protein